MDEPIDPCDSDCAVHGTSCTHLRKLLAEERKLSTFRQERWMNAELRLERTWNEAIDACRKKIGTHNPPCGPDEAVPCNLCWLNAKLTSLLRLDRAGYKTVRERIETKRQEVCKAICERDAEGWHLELEGANKMAGAIAELFGVSE